jgi:hypothetical protein
MGYFDWEKSDVEREINKAIREGKTEVALAMEHNTGYNEQQVINWSIAMGHIAILRGESVLVTFR